MPGGKGACNGGASCAGGTVKTVPAGRPEGPGGTLYTGGWFCAPLGDRPCIPTPGVTTRPFTDTGPADTDREFEAGLPLSRPTFDPVTSDDDVDLDDATDEAAAAKEPGEVLCTAVPDDTRADFTDKASSRPSRDDPWLAPPPVSGTVPLSLASSSAPTLLSFNLSTISLVREDLFRFPAEPKNAGSNEVGFGRSRYSYKLCDSGKQ